MKTKTIILGAGMTGLACGLASGFPVYEKNIYPGGICRSYRKDGFLFENGGGHWIFGEIPEFAKKIMKFNQYSRSSAVQLGGKIPYPLQAQTSVKEPAKGSMEAQLLEQFGPVLCKIFFFPFNERYTARLYRQISAQDSYKNPSQGQKQYNEVYSYPETDLRDFADKLAEGQDIHYKKKVISIKPNLHSICFEDGEIAGYDRLISTLPLDDMARLTGIKLGQKGIRTNVAVLNLGVIPGNKFPKEHWIYTAYSESGFHRMGFYSNVDRKFAPEGMASMYLEWAESHKRKASMDGVITELMREQIIKKVVTYDVNYLNPAYTWKPIDSTWREDTIEALEKKDILMTGRYGRWHFQGIAESLKEGYDLGRRCI